MLYDTMISMEMSASIRVSKWYTIDPQLQEVLYISAFSDNVRTIIKTNENEYHSYFLRIHSSLQDSLKH
jgi:hypothetical protein